MKLISLDEGCPEIVMASGSLHAMNLQSIRLMMAIDAKDLAPLLQVHRIVVQGQDDHITGC